MILRRKLETVDMLVLGILGIAFFGLAEKTLTTRKTPYYETALEASKLTLNAFETLKKGLLEGGYTIDPVNDPAESGLIGLETSPITTSQGVLYSKLTSVNPNFSALVVKFLYELGVKKGDYIAIGMTGSFPALNTATIIAVQTIGAVPVVITSIGSSSFGANRPGWTWLDMENYLFEKGIIKYRSVAASVGGADDIGRGLSPEGREILINTINKYGIKKIHVLPLEKSVGLRMKVYQEANPLQKYKAYINIGGGIASLGSPDVSNLLKPGINQPESRLLLETMPVKGVVLRFMESGIPVIHLDRLTELALRYSLPVAPAAIPDVGEGPLYFEEKYNVSLVVVYLLIYVVIILTLLYFDPLGRLLKRYPQGI